MKPILVFQSDFTYKEGAVCAMYGVVKSVDRKLEIIDGTHELPQFDTWSASYRLYQVMSFWPKGTIFVSIVDPGVGTKRRASVAHTVDGYYVVSPDNGSLTHIKYGVGIREIREIDETINRLKGKNTEGVSVFHGRDLFSYCAARLASGIITFEEVGPKYDVSEVIAHTMHEPVIGEGSAMGMIEINDPNFGNIWTNFPLDKFQQAGFNFDQWLQVTIRHEGQVVFSQRVLFVRTFGDAETGEPILYNNELMRVGLAVNRGSFSEMYKIGHGPAWQIEVTKPPAHS
ncbi:MAG: SAM hydrolase/SAM-dependent halogenase family protein [Brevefilum sp.]|jgi:S-adenosylmethionine hydrolase